MRPRIIAPPAALTLYRPDAGRWAPHPDPLQRFIAKCLFDPTTGCVLWTGGRTQGRGHSVPYGAFWYEGRRWSAHRWAAKHIHGLDIDAPGTQTDHFCPHVDGPPNTLCVEHVQQIPAAVNRELQWVRVQKGCDDAPPAYRHDPTAAPFFDPPGWLVDTLVKPAHEGCPF